MSRRFQNVIAVARRDAESKRIAAGMTGEMHDGGARRILAIVDAWTAGLLDKIPSELEEYATYADATSDPEWKEYERLKEKFNHVGDKRY